MNNRQAAIQSALELLREEGYEVKEPPKPEKAEVSGFILINDSHGWHSYQFTVENKIPEDKYPAIKSAIENILNGTSTLFECHQQALEQMSKMFTEKELLEAEETAFLAARKLPLKAGGIVEAFHSDIFSFPTFSDYKSHNQQSK